MLATILSNLAKTDPTTKIQEPSVAPLVIGVVLLGISAIVIMYSKLSSRFTPWTSMLLGLFMIFPFGAGAFMTWSYHNDKEEYVSTIERVEAHGNRVINPYWDGMNKQEGQSYWDVKDARKNKVIDILMDKYGVTVTEKNPSFDSQYLMSVKLKDGTGARIIVEVIESGSKREVSDVTAYLNNVELPKVQAESKSSRSSK